MALEVGVAAGQSRKVTVQVSELFELHFALFLDRCTEQKPGHKQAPWLEQFMRDHGELHRRLLDFWESPGYFAWDEILPVANQTGTLLDENIDRFFARLPAALAKHIPVPELPTETPDVAPIVRARLEKLRTDERVRGDYVALLEEAWAVLDQLWEKEGRARSIEMARSLRIQNPTLDALRRLLPGVTMLRREEYESTLQAAIDRDELVIVPLWLAADGQCIFELPGVLYVGAGVESGQKVERKREQAEKAAGRLKELSDPTRVSMVMQLIHHPSTITDMANYFELSQPTVSVHMKVLREAGLVAADKMGNQTRYRVDPGAVWEYVSGTLRELGVDEPV
ncbi:MAG: metalloregulator ArsR/SmtB family transcription factor [Dehalococcoidia bacterium]